jgi:hypothetical protein
VAFDVFFQGFVHGEPAPGGSDAMRRVLQPYIKREESQHNFALVSVDGDTADVYLDQDQMMANHISGERPWELLVRGAQAAGWVILPVGCPTCITDEAQRDHLPEGLDADAVLVKTGEDLLRVIRSS